MIFYIMMAMKYSWKKIRIADSVSTSREIEKSLLKLRQSFGTSSLMKLRGSSYLRFHTACVCEWSKISIAPGHAPRTSVRGRKHPCRWRHPHRAGACAPPAADWRVRGRATLEQSLAHPIWLLRPQQYGQQSREQLVVEAGWVLRGAWAPQGCVRTGVAWGTCLVF